MREERGDHMHTISFTYTSPETLTHFILDQKLDSAKNLLVQVFTGICDIPYIQTLQETLVRLLPNACIIGTTTSGEIIEGKAKMHTTVLAFSLFEHTKIRTYASKIYKSSEETANALISQFCTVEEKPRVAISFVDGLHINGEAFIDTLGKYHESLIIAGGLSGDNANFQQTVVFTEKEILPSGAVVALLYNEHLQVATKASFGWESVGKSMMVTRAEGNIIYEIDGECAVDIYGKYLGEDIARNLPQIGVEFPLIVKKHGMEIPRAPLSKSSDGSLVFAGSIHTGDKVTFGYGNLQAILQYGQSVYEDHQVQKSESIFVYSCMARLQLLGENVNDELLPLQSICNVTGFFTYGEFYVESVNHKCELLNETMTILALSESDTVPKREVPPYNYLQKRKNEQSLTLKALSHLISQTSKELEDLNLLLKDRVRREVIKNNHKDRIMLQQTKLAQMGEMISMIAHQWRQPLSSISTLSQTINLQASLGTLDQEGILGLSDMITDTAMHLSQTIDDFREFFKPKKEKQKTSLCEVVESVLKIIETSIITKNIKIIKELNCKNHFYSYPNEIKQVVLNLLKNSQDALLETKVENPYIKIRTYREDNVRILEVCDNAGGVPEDLMSKIFEPYFSTKKKKDGTGLGLYMSKTIIEEHCNGTLGVTNGEEGAIFRIALPLEDGIGYV